jgi:hypothetical protein
MWPHIKEKKIPLISMSFLDSLIRFSYKPFVVDFNSTEEISTKFYLLTWRNFIYMLI